MGASKSIEDKEKADAAFRKFMEEVRTKSLAEEERLAKDVATSVTEHYAVNEWDHARLCGTRNSDYQNYDSWGLDRVNKIIDSIGKALGAGDYPSDKVPGSSDAAPGTIEKAKEFAGIFAGDYTLIVARVKAIIGTFLSQFSTVSEATQKSQLSDLPLSGGLHLFVASSGSTYREERFFSKQYIGSFQIVYETQMSVQEAKTIGLTQILRTTEQEIAMLNEHILRIREIQFASLRDILKKDPTAYKDTRATYEEILALEKADRDNLVAEYDKYRNVEVGLTQLRQTGHLAVGDQSPESLERFFNPWQADVARRLAESESAAGAPRTTPRDLLAV